MENIIAGTAMLMIAGSTLASAQQSSPAERPHRERSSQLMTSRLLPMRASRHSRPL